MRRWVLGALAAGMAVSGSAQAAVPVPRPGCFAVRDAAGAGSFAAEVDPSASAVSDAAIDITGLNLGVTPRAVTLYLSLQKLADPGTAAGTLPAYYDARLSRIGGKPLMVWFTNWGPAQPARAVVPDGHVPDPTTPGYDLWTVRGSQGAEVGEPGMPGAPVRVTVTKDLAHSFVAWTFDRSVLERALRVKFTKGTLLTLGRATARYDAVAFPAPADELTEGLVKVGSSRCV